MKRFVECAEHINTQQPCEGFNQFGMCGNKAEYSIKTRGGIKNYCEEHTDLMGYLPPKENNEQK